MTIICVVTATKVECRLKEMKESEIEADKKTQIYEMIIKKERIYTIFICIALNVSVFFLCFVDENILCFPECSFLYKIKINKLKKIRKCRRRKEKKKIEKKIHLSFKKLKRKEKFKINW